MIGFWDATAQVKEISRYRVLGRDGAGEGVVT